ncbi:MAG: MFS transporter [Thermoflexales bacterium]|nr:MFS transporter [Thermoflexales bacterium]
MKDRSNEIKAGGPTWQRTLVVIWFAEFVALIGFAMVAPFLPFYVQDLGIHDESQVKLWSGMLLSAHAVLMGIFAPIWGSLADRYGRKPMLERAMFGSAAVMVLSAFCQTPGQLLALRVLLGALTGTVTAAMTLVASVVPRERLGFALGLLQTGIFAGISVGPLVGGVVADTWGYRAAFLLTGACLFAGGLGVFFFVREEFTRPAAKAESQHWWDGLAMVVRMRDSLAVLGLRLLTRAGGSIITPILPLFVASLLPGSSQVATMAGIVVGASAATSSIGAVFLGQAGDRVGHQRILLLSAAVAAVLYVLQSQVSSIIHLIVLQFCVGAAIAGTVSSLTALLATLAPEGQQGAIYGLDTTVVSIATALGPLMGASLAMIWGNRAAFLLSGGVFGLTALSTAWLLPRSQAQVGKPVEAIGPAAAYSAVPVETTKTS